MNQLQLPRVAAGKRCKGASILATGDPYDNDRPLHTDGSTVVALDGHFVLDSRAQKNRPKNALTPLHNGNETTGYLITTRRYKRLEERNGKSVLFTFKTSIRTKDGESKNIKHHQLVNRAANNIGLGLEEIQVDDDADTPWTEAEKDIETYLDGQSLEEKFCYTTNILEEGQRRISSDLDKNRHAKDCDVDHAMKRTRRIYNGIFATMPCSHLANTCAAIVRKECGDWCFGLTVVPYRGGN